MENFASFLDDLVHELDSISPVTHILDYGSGQAYLSRTLSKKYSHNVIGLESRQNNITASINLDKRYDHLLQKSAKRRPDLDLSCGELTYLQTHVSYEDALPCRASLPEKSSLLLTSLHSCGNLLHHALRAFATTPSVRAVALIGCCHNLLTERHGVTYKTNHLRTPHPRVTAMSSEADPAGFPISKKFYDEGVTLNITARSMAVQAPYNWTRDSSAGFFKRHFYRALLQRVFQDRGLAESAEPVTIGSLRPPAYVSFAAYAKAAADKLGWELGINEEELASYEERFSPRWKDLSVVWSLMAFTSSVVESLIVVDRWEFLGEVEGVKERWVEVVFGYEHSPRNLCVVGVR